MLGVDVQMMVRVGKLTVRVSSDEAVLLDTAVSSASARWQSASNKASGRQQWAPAKRSSGKTSAVGRFTQPCGSVYIRTRCWVGSSCSLHVDSRRTCSEYRGAVSQ